MHSAPLKSPAFLRCAGFALACVAATATAADGYVSFGGRPMLGIEMSPVPLTIQQQQGLNVEQGVLVRQVFHNTAAAGMGVQPGDLVLSVNSNPITGMTSLRTEVCINNIGDPVSVTVSRNGQQQTLNGTLAQWPPGIPYEPIDPNVEEQFKQWQRRRIEQNQEQVAGINQQIAEIRNYLKQPHPEAATTPDAAVAEAMNYLSLIPGWRLAVDYGIKAADVNIPVASPVIETAVDEPLAAAGQAWRISYRTPAAP